jgi:putative Mg2+ transporter-C (MgtC) family protein
LAGGGFIYQALFGAIAVLISNTVLRPIAHRINAQSLQGTERQLGYQFSLICQRKQEIHVRALLLQSLSASNITLRSLHSEDYEHNPEKINVEAEMITQIRDDQLLEQIASRLSLQKGVISVSWRVLEEEFG